jgi:hypothetical protein
LATTPEFAKAQRQRKKVEALFAELKNQIGLRRLRLHRNQSPLALYWLPKTMTLLDGLNYYKTCSNSDWNRTLRVERSPSMLSNSSRSTVPRVTTPWSALQRIHCDTFFNEN